MTDIQKALLKAGIIKKEKINEYNKKKYLKQKKESEKQNGRR